MEKDSERRDYTYSFNFGSEPASAASAVNAAGAFYSFLGDDISALDGAVCRLKGSDQFENRFWSGMDLSQLYKEGSQMQKEDIPAVGMENIFRAGFKEFMRLRQQPSMDKEAIMEGAQRAMRVAYSERGRKAREAFAVSRNRRIGLGIYRSVWYGNRHHEFIYRSGQSGPGYDAGDSPGYCGGSDSNCDGFVCRDTRRGCLQPLFRHRGQYH